MALHRLTSITIGVPNVAETVAYYADFGLALDREGWFTTRDAGRQLSVVHAPTRRLVEARVGVDTPDDLAGAASRLRRLGVESTLTGTALTAYDRATAVAVVLETAPRVTQEPVAATPYNGPGRAERTGSRAPGLLRTDRVRPRKLGRAVWQFRHVPPSSGPLATLTGVPRIGLPPSFDQAATTARRKWSFTTSRSTSRLVAHS